MADTQVPQAQPQVITQDELYRQYGEATIQQKIATSRVQFLEQQIQQFLNQPQPQSPQAPVK